MRLLIYLLAMFSGFSAAEAARPISAMPAAVDATAGQTYAAAVVQAIDKTQIVPQYLAPFGVALATEILPAAETLTVKRTTPVLRHDIILG